MGVKRKVVESPLQQGEDEAIAYILDTTNGAGSGAITNASDLIKDPFGNNVSTTYLTGSVAVSGAEITTRKVSGLVKDNRYRMEVKWDQNNNTFESYFHIDAEE